VLAAARAEAPRIKLLKVAAQKFDFLTFEELTRLLNAVKADSAARRAYDRAS
jgi:hypothetical protein